MVDVTGGQHRYSNVAIMTALTLRAVFRLPLRQTEGFLSSILRLMGLDLGVPDHTTLSRRNRDVELTLLRRRQDGPLHLIVDSTGLKVLGNGEWRRRKHGTRTRRTWRKLHVGVDTDGFIVASKLTESREADASQVPELLEQVGEDDLSRFTADGAYDTRDVYDAIVGHQGQQPDAVIPPRKRAAISRKADRAAELRNDNMSKR